MKVRVKSGSKSLSQITLKDGQVPFILLCIEGLSDDAIAVRIGSVCGVERQYEIADEEPDANRKEEYRGLLFRRAIPKLLQMLKEEMDPSLVKDVYDLLSLREFGSRARQILEARACKPLPRGLENCLSNLLGESDGRVSNNGRTTR